MEKSCRSQRNRSRRHSRRLNTFDNDDDDLLYQQPAKRLFTPEIKRLLKEWLIRRRENPYPSREEKKCLAFETGLTYTQICNWFANWRRKLKNSEKEQMTKQNSWGHLIKNYNINVKGNVEQFSISSEDSIWEEDEEPQFCYDNNYRKTNDDNKANNTNYFQINNVHYDNENLLRSNEAMPQDFYNDYYISEETSQANFTCPIAADGFPNSTKYKQKIMEKYLKDTQQLVQNKLPAIVNTSSLETCAKHENECPKSTKTELTKWLESANKFTPNKHNYFIECKDNNINKKDKCYSDKLNSKLARTIHNTEDNLVISSSSKQINNTPYLPLEQVNLSNEVQNQDELDAAEALTNLAFNCRQKLLEMETTSTKNFFINYKQSLNIISS